MILTKRELLEEAKCHYISSTAAIIAAVVAAASAAAQARMAAVAKSKAKRNAANAQQMAAQGGEADPKGPTATRFRNALDESGKDDMGARLSEMMSKQQQPEMQMPQAQTQEIAPQIGADASGIQERQRQQDEERRRLLEQTMMGKAVF